MGSFGTEACHSEVFEAHFQAQMSGSSPKIGTATTLPVDAEQLEPVAELHREERSPLFP